MGPLGESGDSWLGRSGNGYVVSWHLQDCSPRLGRLRTIRLAPASKYWTYRSHAGDMGPVSLVAGHRQRVALPQLLQWLARERNWVCTHGSVSRRVGDCVRSPFSQEQRLCSSLLKTSQKVTTYGDPPQEAYAGRMWTGVESVRVVLVRFPPVGCTSIRIVVTLGYE
jgi:hypothetical protein